MDFKMLDDFLDSLPVETQIPGVDFTIYKEHEPIYRHMAGYSDLENKVPVKGNELYNLYSATKVITCTAALQLLEKGKYVLWEPVSEYLPEFKEMYRREYQGNGNYEIVRAKNPIRIVDLFTMSAGLTYDLNTPAIDDVRKATDGKCPTREIMKAIAKQTLMFEPGTHWNYSLCHDVIGGLIEVISGKKFGEYLKENIFEPLGMKNTGFERNDVIHARMAEQYEPDFESGKAKHVSKENPYILGSEYESGGAGLYSCVDDYILFVDAMANGGVGKTGERILSSATIDLMRTNQLDEVRMKEFNWDQLRGYGYGLGVRTMVDRAKGVTIGPVGEFGWDGAKGALAIIDPDNHIAAYYAEHLGGMHAYVHPRLRNVMYACLEL